MKQFIIFGEGDFADYVWCMLTEMLHREVAAFTVDQQYLKNTEKRGLPVLPFEHITEHYSPQEFSMALGFIGGDMMQIREKRFQECARLGFELENIIAPSVVNHSRQMGVGNIIAEGTILEPFSSVGSGNVFFDMSLLGHHVELGDFNLLSSCIVPCGMSKIKNHCFIGAGSIIGNRVTVADYTLVGANAYVKSDTNPYDVVVPAKGATLEGVKSTEFGL